MAGAGSRVTARRVLTFNGLSLSARRRSGSVVRSALSPHILTRWSWLDLHIRQEALWQRHVPVTGMRRFWDEMGERARDTIRPR